MKKLSIEMQETSVRHGHQIRDLASVLGSIPKDALVITRASLKMNYASSYWKILRFYTIAGRVI
jgi:hypothetical protein